MKIGLYLTSVATLLMMFTTVVCGLWIKANHITDVSSMKFHTSAGIITAVLTVILVILIILLGGYLNERYRNQIESN